MVEWFVSMVIKICKLIVLNFKACTWSIGRRFFPKQVTRLEKKMADRAEKTRLKNIEKKIRDKIEEIWEQYDRDRSGSLDKEESRDFIRDLLDSMDLYGGYTDRYFDEIFQEFDADESGTVEKNEMLLLIKKILGLEVPEDKGF